MNQLSKLAESVMAYDYGVPMPRTKTGSIEPVAPPVGPARPRDPFAADFGQETTTFPHLPTPIHPGGHQTITVKTPPPRSIFLDFAFQTLAVVTGTFIVQKYVVPRLEHRRGGLIE